MVSDGSRVCHRCIVLLLFVECMDLWQLVSTHYYIGGHLFTKLVVSICLSLSLLLFGDVVVKAVPLRS